MNDSRVQRISRQYFINLSHSMRLLALMLDHTNAKRFTMKTPKEKNAERKNVEKNVEKNKCRKKKCRRKKHRNKKTSKEKQYRINEKCCQMKNIKYVFYFIEKQEKSSLMSITSYKENESFDGYRCT